MFVFLAIGAFFANFFQISCSITVGERLTRRLRGMTFRHILRQNIGYFDEEKNSTGSLTAQLATDATLVQGLTGSLVGTFLQIAATLITGMIISFINGWQLTLVILALLPMIALAGALQMKVLQGSTQKTKEALEDVAQGATEAIANFKTVAALTMEKSLNEKYEKTMEKPHATAVKGAIYSSLGFGASQGIFSSVIFSIPFLGLCYCVLLWIAPSHGSHLYFATNDDCLVFGYFHGDGSRSDCFFCAEYSKGTNGCCGDFRDIGP